MHFGCETFHKPFPLEGRFEDFLHGVSKIVVFIIDGLSYSKFVKFNRELGFESVLKVSSVFPTTTVAAVTSWFTGRTPKEHGLLGYVLYLREIGSIVNMIEFTYPGVEGGIFAGLVKRRLHRLENVFDVLKTKELYGGVLTHAAIANSGLSYLIHRNGHVMTYMYMGDLLATLRKRLGEEWRGVLYVYWGHLDGLGHKKGPDSEAFDFELVRLLKEIGSFAKDHLPPDALLILTSDHGMVHVPAAGNFFLKPTDSFNKHLSSPPGGEMRMMYLYLRKKSDLEPVASYFTENYPGAAEIIPARDCVADGLFGDGRAHPELYNRIGDAIMLARERYAFTYLYSGGEERLLGMHGSLTDEEVFVPAAFVRS